MLRGYYELIFFNAIFVSSKFFSKRLSSFDLSIEVVIIFFTESTAIFTETFYISLRAASFI